MTYENITRSNKNKFSMPTPYIALNIQSVKLKSKAIRQVNNIQIAHVS